MILYGRAEWCWGFLREGRAEPYPYGVGGCKREVQRNKREKQGNKKGNAKGEGQEKEKKETGGIGNYKRKRSFLGKA